METSKRWFGSETAFGRSIKIIRGRRLDRVVAARHGPWGPAVAFARKRRRENSEEDLGRRAARAVRQVELGELSAGRQALEGESVAPGTFENVEGSH